MNLTTVNNIEDVHTFLDFCISYLGLGFHPDNSFENYVEEDNKPCFTKEESELYNRLMAESFDVCEAINFANCETKIDIYTLCVEKTEPLIKKVMERIKEKNNGQYFRSK